MRSGSGTSTSPGKANGGWCRHQPPLSQSGASSPGRDAVPSWASRSTDETRLVRFRAGRRPGRGPGGSPFGAAEAGFRRSAGSIGAEAPPSPLAGNEAGLVPCPGSGPEGPSPTVRRSQVRRSARVPAGAEASADPLSARTEPKSDPRRDRTEVRPLGIGSKQAPSFRLGRPDRPKPGWASVRSDPEQAPFRTLSNEPGGDSPCSSGIRAAPPLPEGAGAVGRLGDRGEPKLPRSPEPPHPAG